MNNSEKTIVILNPETLADLQRTAIACAQGTQKLDPNMVIDMLLNDGSIGKYFNTSDIVKINMANQNPDDVIGIYQAFIDGIRNVCEYEGFDITSEERTILSSIIANLTAAIKATGIDTIEQDGMLVALEEATIVEDETMIAAIEMELASEDRANFPEETILEAMESLDDDEQEEFAEAIDMDNAIGGEGPIFPQEEPPIEDTIEVLQDAVEGEEFAEEALDALNEDIRTIEEEHGPIFDEDEIINITEDGEILPSPRELAEDVKNSISVLAFETFKIIKGMLTDEEFITFFTKKFNEDIFFDAIEYINRALPDVLLDNDNNPDAPEEETPMHTADNRFRMTRDEMYTFLRFINDSEWAPDTENIGSVSTLDFYMAISEAKTEEEMIEYIKEHGPKAYAEVNRLEIFVDRLTEDMKNNLYPPLEYDYAYKTLQICKMLQTSLLPYVGEYRPMVYIAGDLLNKGSIMLRNMEAEDIRSIGYQVYSPIEDKEINDKQHQTIESNSKLAEKIVKKDTDGIFASDIILIEPAAHALGTLCELGQVKGMKDVANLVVDAIDNWMGNDDEDAYALIGEILSIVQPIKDKKVFAHMQDIRVTDIPEVGFRRSFSVNQYIHGVVLDLTEGRGFEKYEDILTKLREMTKAIELHKGFDDHVEEQAEIERQYDEAVEHEVVIEEE